MSRETVLIPSRGINLEAWVYKPETQGPHAVVVMCCGIGAVKMDGLPTFAQAFQEAGYSAVTFDYASFGGSEGNPRNVVMVGHEYQDLQAIIHWVRQQPTFDSSRIVAWGTSFGGMHVTRLLAEDDAIAAGIAQCPCVDGLRASKMKPIIRSLQLSFWGICDWLGSLLGRSPIYIRLASTPESTSLALMETPDAVLGWVRLHGASSNGADGSAKNRIAARSTLTFPFHRPALMAHKCLAPYLIVAPSYDSVAPLQAAKVLARRAPRGELRQVPGGHFDLYLGGVGFAENLKVQLSFLSRVIPPNPVKLENA
ncbi:hypothetical protein ASPBRDRAFT_199001 [Aspergillus brasiliensis CBS 101740]|uniref:Xaa-Pro dipeptidyl-peptidase-like domain-containing protein n=1 Tax=Aspergillus brasiliensis (strain CBS 101740 / IMI 381727 / IBT 21946) TaxID=767769 RepID=A0A1L9UAC4_ASPBC|nr:hypothetical protein ASPBRDRAFT_199001 [Aspergillus brasiliensis CBS 101740]